MTGLIIAAVIVYLAFHHRHYRRNRRRGMGFWVSCRGPWGTRIGTRL